VSTKTFRIVMSITLYLLAGAVSAPQGRLSAPSYYIAGKATYDGRPDELRVQGVSNLPVGSRLYVSVFRYVGEGIPTPPPPPS
jgi:hypothetical protein